MPGTHALLSPSSAGIWTKCTPSARLAANFQDASTEAAEEGALAHAFGELILQHRFMVISKPQFIDGIARLQRSEYFSPALLEYADQYATYVQETYNAVLEKTPDAVIYIEKRIDLTGWVPEGFGTGDAGIVADDTLHLIDLKYGKGVAVSAEDNTQLKIYALGVLDAFGFEYDIINVVLHIYQPRLDNISAWQISVEDLRAWGETVLKPKARLAWNGEGDFVPGTHCQFCRARATCKALAEYNLELARYDFQSAELLTAADIVDILRRADMFTSWLNAVKDYAFDQALNHGVKWDGYKLVEGRSNRTITNEDGAVTALLHAGYKLKELYKPAELRTITDLEKLMGKKKFTEVLQSYITKPPGKPALVPESDKRPEINSVSSAAADFAEMVTE